MTTLRGELISQLRCALGELERPLKEEEYVEFTISDITFEYSQEALCEPITDKEGE